MKPVQQDRFGQGQGNCFAACLASILELPLEEVPNLCSDEAESDGSHWLKRCSDWLAPRGWGFVFIPWGAHSLPFDCWAIVCGKPAGRTTAESHAVVGRTKITQVQVAGESWEWAIDLIHDPHPSGAFLDGAPTSLIVLVPAAG